MKKKQTNIQTYVQLYLDDVELNISVTDKLKRQEDRLKNFGYIQVTTGAVDEKPVFWDGIEFFLECDEKQFKKECKRDLDKAGFDCDTTYKIIKKLLKRAIKLKLLYVDNLKAKEDTTFESAREKAQAEYTGLINSGLFFEFYPSLTGDFKKDEEEWYKIHSELEVLRLKIIKEHSLH
jgi:hypothetical protein